MFPCGASFSGVFDEMFIEVTYFHKVQPLHMQKPGILGILEHSEPFHYCTKTHIQNPIKLTKIYEYPEL